MKTVRQIHAYNGDEVVYSKTYYSIGGGFIVDEEHFGQDAANRSERAVSVQICHRTARVL